MRFLPLWFTRNGFTALLVLGGIFIPASAAGKSHSSVAISSEIIHTIHLTGATAFPEDQLQKQIPLKPSMPLDLDKVRFATGVLEGFYRDHGYADVHVSTATVPYAAHQADLTFHIREGPLYHIRSIRIEGNRFLSEKIIKRHMQLKPGDPFSQTRIYDATRSLFLAGYFENSDISYSSAPEHGIDILAKVKERPTRYVKGGWGYGAKNRER